MKYSAPTNDKITQMEVDHMEIAKQLAGECVVLLENNGCLPLKGTGKAALYGPGARNTVKGGTGSGDVNTRNNVNFEDGMEQAGFEITSKVWLDRYSALDKKAHADYLNYINEESKRTGMPGMMLAFSNPFTALEPEPVKMSDIAESNTDTAIYIISRNSGEGADRFDREGDYKPFPEEINSIKLLGQNYKNVVVVLNIGGVMELNSIKEIPGVGAIVLITQLGNIGGTILPQILLGQVNPSGKLVDTWAKNYMDYPSSKNFSHNNGNIDDDDYEEGIYVGYRYFDSFHVEPLYPFGYGLSYTSFEICNEKAAVKGNKVTVTATVKNIGSCSGKEVVQVYVSKPGKVIDVPYQELAAYQKTNEIAPDQSENIEICFDMDSLASYHENQAAYILEAGSYVIRIGNCSRNTKAVAALELPSDVVTLECRNTFSLDRKIQCIKPDGEKTEENVTRIVVDVDAIPSKKVSYQEKRELYTTNQTKTLKVQDVMNGDCTVEELVAQLSVQELAMYCVGTARNEEEANGDSIIGAASESVPGAAGDSTGLLYESRGIKNLIQADGPAGLRLQTHFKTTADGKVLPGGEMFGDFINPFDEEKLPKDAVDYYQYCTAIPIGWALAMSWNDELVQRAGDMMGEEMEVFQIDLWLAPAMNIHRNPLCGRNFEYYSEDPVVSGRIASAMTKGVQSHPGKGTTIKHFAANNQEDNRYFTNVHASERTLREIYLKGFEIAVKNSQPLALMTSYNLINGTHTANNKDLLQYVLRDEWGFKGLVMTDWFTSQDTPALTGSRKPKYPISASTGCVFAGNDLQMPGCSKNVSDLVEAVENETELDGYVITKADLQYCAANVIRVAVEALK